MLQDVCTVRAQGLLGAECCQKLSPEGAAGGCCFLLASVLSAVPQTVQATALGLKDTVDQRAQTLTWAYNLALDKAPPPPGLPTPPRGFSFLSGQVRSFIRAHLPVSGDLELLSSLARDLVEKDSENWASVWNSWM